MSTGQKVVLAHQAKGKSALGAALAAVELPRSTWYYRQRHGRAYTQKYDHLREPLERVAWQHPEYGYRRATVELREVYGQRINHKVVQRLHQAWDLPLLRTVKPPKPSGIRRVITVAGGRVNLVANQGAIRPLDLAYTDFTELVYASGRRKAYLIPILDHASKMVLGWAVGDRAVTELALQAWKRAKSTLTEQGAESKGLIVHHDQDRCSRATAGSASCWWRIGPGCHIPSTEPGATRRWRASTAASHLPWRAVPGRRRTAPCFWMCTRRKTWSAWGGEDAIPQQRTATLNHWIASTRSLHRDSVAADVASQIRMPESVQEMGCTAINKATMDVLGRPMGPAFPPQYDLSDEAKERLREEFELH